MINSQYTSYPILFLLIPLILLIPTTFPLTAQEEEPEHNVQVWLTTADQTKLLQQQPNIVFKPNTTLITPTATEGDKSIITINEEKAYQQIEGFGAAFTDSSAWLIYNKLSTTQRNALMHQLFDPHTGIGLSVIRIPMGSSDFALSNYTYNDNNGQPDPNLNTFSIKHDTAYIIPLLQQVQQINPQITFIATPWSPPAWMKTSQSLYGGKLKPEYYQTYANYFVKFINAYQSYNIPIKAITIQNEPLHESKSYPTMLLSENEAITFIKNYLGPTFEKNNISTKILILDHNWEHDEYPINVLNDPTVRKHITGTAFHCYAGQVDNQSTVYSAHPDKEIYFTECSGGEWVPDFGNNLHWSIQNLIIGTTRHWAKTVLLLNIALDTNHGPQNGGCKTCRGIVTIDQTTQAITSEIGYYTLGHISKFVKPGALRIDSNSFTDFLESVAFKNPDGSRAILVFNPTSKTRNVTVRWNNKAFTYTIPAKSVTTFQWRPPFFVFIPLSMATHSLNMDVMPSSPTNKH